MANTLSASRIRKYKLHSNVIQLFAYRILIQSSKSSKYIGVVEMLVRMC